MGDAQTKNQPQLPDVDTHALTNEIGGAYLRPCFQDYSTCSTHATSFKNKSPYSSILMCTDPGTHDTQGRTKNKRPGHTTSHLGPPSKTRALATALAIALAIALALALAIFQRGKHTRHYRLGDA